MATLTVQGPISRAGVAATPVAATVTVGDEFANDGNTYVEIINGSGGSINVSLDIKPTVDGGAVTDRVVAVANGARKIIGPFPVKLYNNPTTGRAKVTCSAVSSVTIWAFKV